MHSSFRASLTGWGRLCCDSVCTSDGWCLLLDGMYITDTAVGNSVSKSYQKMHVSLVLLQDCTHWLAITASAASLDALHSVKTVGYRHCGTILSLRQWTPVPKSLPFFMLKTEGIYFISCTNTFYTKSKNVCGSWEKVMLLHWTNATVKTSLRRLPWQQKSKSGGGSGRALLRSPRACRTLLEAYCLSSFQIFTVCCTCYCWSQSQVLGWRGQIPQWNWSSQCYDQQCSKIDWMDFFSCTSTKTSAWIMMPSFDKYSTKHPRRMLFMNPLSRSSE